MQAVTAWQQDKADLSATEKRWVDKARAGDRLAFEKLYRSHCDRIHALCWRMCGGDRALAEDMVQEAFVRAWNKLELFKGDSKFGTWLHRVTVNVVLSDRRIRIKRLKREQAFSDDIERVQVGERNVFAGLRKDLEAAIAGLPERARTVLILYDVEGYQHQEIADMTGMAVGSSKAQLHRARKMVREVLQDSDSI
ncbi:MAG: sigma-70 family RNA polymerase sigma factor [Gammaproteobacteria bacterium]|nr:sigma-70 family RNA polymerase sigma factor [Gammaproteobacteria bacterium]NNL00370.1 sigma-70 family RNA polymerase sigma factor [Xanthomonadales bacterium]